VYACVCVCVCVYHQAGDDDDDEDGDEEEACVETFSAPHVVSVLALQDVLLQARKIFKIKQCWVVPTGSRPFRAGVPELYLFIFIYIYILYIYIILFNVFINIIHDSALLFLIDGTLRVH